MHGKLIKVC